MHNWFLEFQAFSFQHILTACVFLLGAYAFARTGATLRTRRDRADRLLLLAWIAALVAANAYSTWWWYQPERFTPSYTHPLHICDIAVWVSPFALLLPSRFLKSVVYFWGLGLSGVALLYPTLTEGLTHTRFWLYWICHTQIVGSALYLVVAQRFRPTKRDLRNAMLAIAAYNAAILPVNVLKDWDYGYTGPGSTVVAFLGPWPMRAAIMLALEWLSMVLLWLPFRAGGAEQEEGRDAR